jgi:prepilin-type N-terminal cleavage/methylation domain-containing protein
MTRGARNGRARAGFTLIEAVVVLAVIGILLALVVPAVMVARESAWKAECANRLKQLGIALHSHQSIYNHFPSPMPPRTFRGGSSFANFDSISGYYELLPFLELVSVYNSINTGYAYRGFHLEFQADHPHNQTAFSTRLSHFVCPSDNKKNSSEGKGPNSFRFNVGLSDPFIDAGSPKAGAFEGLIFLAPSEFRDGLSRTVGMSERLLSDPIHAGYFDRNRDYWCAGVVRLIDTTDADSTLRVCRSLQDEPYYYVSKMGYSWMMAGPVNMWYNHVAPPNEKWPDCSTGHGNMSDPYYCHTCSIAARSVHYGGVHGLMMDGGVRFVGNGIDLQVWRAMGTRSGGESFSN